MCVYAIYSLSITALIWRSRGGKHNNNKISSIFLSSPFFFFFFYNLSSCLCCVRLTSTERELTPLLEGERMGMSS